MLIIAVEQFHKGSLRTGGALRAQHAQIFDTIVDLVEVHEQLVHPKSCTLADGGQLCGLEMGETKGGLAPCALLRRQTAFPERPPVFCVPAWQAFTQLNDVGIIAYISAGRSEMDMPAALGATLPKA